MTAPRDELLIKARQWMAHAGDDLHVARHILTISLDCPFRLVAYHAQQCAEKCLKAWLVYLGIDFPYTHNIARLLELCLDGAPWAADLSDAEKLTVFATTVRYPGDEEPVDEEEACRAVDIAARVQEVVAAAFLARGVKL